MSESTRWTTAAAHSGPVWGAAEGSRSIARWRLGNQHLLAPGADCVDDVMSRLLAVQAENPGQSAWAVATRTARPDDTALQEALEQGRVLRTHVLRPTWHYVTADDLDWLLALTGPRVVGVVDSQLQRDLGLSTRDVDELTTVVLDLLGTDPDRTRTEVTTSLRQRVPRLADTVTGRLTMLLMCRLEVERLVASGRPRGGEHTYARYEDRVPGRVDAEVFDRDAALAGLAERYFTGHGPATDKDLAYWASLPITDIRRGREAIDGALESFEHEGRTYWHADDAAPDDRVEPHGHLLQVLDEMYRGYQDSRMVLDARGVVPRGRESAIGMALVDGQLVAGMRRTVSTRAVTFALSPYAPLTPVERAAIDAAAERYGTYLGLPAQVEAP
ncbi:winged helix DNA-binding domain-containing protein [Janibacter cremeus]|uniref:winged helix DNA-binding domain-containing protein n=1 Tax=Janibacter cremeus TaxID=1285192 RepID=UPI0023F89F4A|nr:winged helix DNA-binding domain-containing protein [Janibacter cremeus]WEV77260.1 winged helix DNA-binding domain-containing protein [Janibacter cremeus]